MVVNLEIKFIFLYLLHKKIRCFWVKSDTFWCKRSDVFVLPLPFYNDNIKEYQRYIKEFRRLWLCRNYGLTESWRLYFALPRQQDNEYGGSRLVVSWSCSLRSIIRLPAPKIYLLYSLYHLYLYTM